MFFARISSSFGGHVEFGEKYIWHEYMISLSLLFNWIISEEVAIMVVSLRMTNEPSTASPLLLCQSITGLPHPSKLILQDNLMASPSTPSVDKLLVLMSQTGSDSEGIRRLCSFIHFGIAPLKVHYCIPKGAPERSTATVSEFHAEAPKANASEGLSKSPYLAAIEFDSNLRPSRRMTPVLPLSHHASSIIIFLAPELSSSGELN